MKYRIIAREYKTYTDYTVQRKSLIGWHDTYQTFNTIGEARDFINRRFTPIKSIVEVLDV